MSIFLNCVSIPLFICGLVIGLYNWWASFHNFRAKNEDDLRITPLFVGAGFMTIAAYISQNKILIDHILLFWIIDFMGIPAIVFLALYYLVKFVRILIKYIIKVIGGIGASQ